MADFDAIASVGVSIQRLLSDALGQAPEPVPGQVTRAALVRTDDFTRGVGTRITANCCAVYLYKVEPNRTMRAAWSGVGFHDGIGRLPLDLHYLLTAYSTAPEFEHRILGRVLQTLETTPVLTGPLLGGGGGWAPHEAVHLQLDELPLDQQMRIFDQIPGDFRLSLAYLARVVRLDGRTAFPDPTVSTVVTGLTPSAVP
jgi:hypothetical protein